MLAPRAGVGSRREGTDLILLGTLTQAETRPGSTLYTKIEGKHVVRVLVRETIDNGIVFAVQDAECRVPYQWYASSHEAVNWACYYW